MILSLILAICGFAARAAASPWRIAVGAGAAWPQNDARFQGLRTTFSPTLAMSYGFARRGEVLLRLAYAGFGRDDAGTLRATGPWNPQARNFRLSGGNMTTVDVMADIRFLPSQGPRPLATQPFVVAAVGISSYDYKSVDITYAWAGHTWHTSAPGERGTSLVVGVGIGLRFGLAGAAAVEIESRYQEILRSGENLRSVPLWLALATRFGSQ